MSYYGILESFPLPAGWPTLPAAGSPPIRRRSSPSPPPSARNCPRPAGLRQMDQPRQRLRLRHQRRHPRQVAGPVAVRPVAMLSIASKYALRVKDRHFWNPTNFGVTALLLLSIHPASLSVQYGNNVWAPIVIWVLGGLILSKIGKLHIPLTFAAVYLLISPIRNWVTGNAWLTEVCPDHVADDQLFMCFMITDPKTVTAQGLESMRGGRAGGRCGGGFRLHRPGFPDARTSCPSTPRSSPCSSWGRPRTRLRCVRVECPQGAERSRGRSRRKGTTGTGASGRVYPRRRDQPAG